VHSIRNIRMAISFFFLIATSARHHWTLVAPAFLPAMRHAQPRERHNKNVAPSRCHNVADIHRPSTYSRPLELTPPIGAE
jgi:hypothetical protein